MNIQSFTGLDNLVKTFRVDCSSGQSHTLSIHTLRWYTCQDEVVGVELVLVLNEHFEGEKFFVFRCSSLPILAKAWRPNQGFSLSMFAERRQSLSVGNFATRVIVSQLLARMAAED